MSKPNLPDLPPRIDWHDEFGIEVYAASQMRDYATQAVREALAAQVARISEAMAAMSMEGVNGGAVQKEYFKAGARRAIHAVNSAIIPENSDG